MVEQLLPRRARRVAPSDFSFFFRILANPHAGPQHSTGVFFGVVWGGGVFFFFFFFSFGFVWGRGGGGFFFFFGGVFLGVFFSFFFFLVETCASITATWKGEITGNAFFS